MAHTQNAEQLAHQGSSATGGGLGGVLPSTTATTTAQNTPTPSSTIVSSNPSTTPAPSSRATSGSASSPTAGSSSSNGHNDTGVIAGAAVGAALGAALLTFLLTFFFFRRKMNRFVRQYRQDQNARSEKDGRNQQKKSTDVGASWEMFLPQQEDDITITRLMTTFLDQIDSHVHNYYTAKNVDDSHRSPAMDYLSAVHLPAPLGNLLADKSLVLPTIKHCIASTICANISVGGPPGSSLLPPHLALAPTRLHNAAVPANERSAARRVYSKWRSMTAFLYPDVEDDAFYTQLLDKRVDNMDKILADAFAPWNTNTNDPAQQRHRISIIRSAAHVGVVLTSQPSIYEFRWDAGAANPSTHSSRELTIFPGLCKTTDDQGCPLEQMVIAPTVVRV